MYMEKPQDITIHGMHEIQECFRVAFFFVVRRMHSRSGDLKSPRPSVSIDNGHTELLVFRRKAGKYEQHFIVTVQIREESPSSRTTFVMGNTTVISSREDCIAAGDLV